MRLRTRLAVAFLLMSVVPLTAITLYSYSSSIKAFRSVVEAEETAIAASMGRQMDMVTTAVGDRVDRVSAAAEAGDWMAGRAQEERFRREVATTLGDAAGFVTRLRFVPAPLPPGAAPPPDGRRSSRPPHDPGSRGATGTASSSAQARPGSVALPPPPPAPPSAGQPSRPVPPSPPADAKSGIDLVSPDAAPDVPALTNLKELSALKDLPSLRNLDTPRLGDLMRKAGPQAAAAYEAAMATAEKAIQQRARAIERQVRVQEQRSAEWQQRMARMREGKPVDIPVRRDGRVVGTMNAEISVERVLLSVLSDHARDSGDIAFAIDPQKRLHTTRRTDRRTLESLALFGRVRNSTKPSETLSDDDWILVTRRDPSGFVFGIARPIGNALGQIRKATGRNLGLGMLAIMVALVGIAPLSRRMTRNLSVLHTGVNQIAQGDLSARVPVRSRDEIGQLAQAFNRMAEDLGAHQKLIAERERLRGELELCRQIQNEMLPKHPLLLPFAEIKGVSIPAREVGGDFFNYFMLPDDEVGLLVGDVSGKGVGAALLMANIQATLRARLPVDHDLAHLADTIDREVEENTPASVYLTLFVGVLDSAQRTLRYVNAGHNPQFVLRSGGGLERLPSTGLPVGMFAGHGYKETSISLAEGDVLFFYTDGITEVENEAGEMFGSERLERLLVDHHLDGIDQLLAKIEQEVERFRGHAEPFDDATMMVLRVGAGGTVTT